MICQHCRSAAELALQAEVIWQYLDGKQQETFTGPEAARRWHAACRGGTWCDCGHVIPVRALAERLTLGK